jgi:hypothetical protein
VKWSNSTLLEGDCRESRPRSRTRGAARSSPRQTAGSCRPLIEHDLIDEYPLWTFPVLLGSGKRSSTRNDPAGLELIDSTMSSAGVVIGRYRRAGDIRYGSFAVDERGGVEALCTEGEER